MFSSIQIIMVGFAFDRGWSYPGLLTQTSQSTARTGGSFENSEQSVYIYFNHFAQFNLVVI